MYKLTPTTTAATYSLNTVEYGSDVTITVIGVLESGEAIEIVCPGSGTASDSDLYIDGTKIEITPTNSLVRIAGSTKLVVSKGTTTNAVGFIVI